MGSFIPLANNRENEAALPAEEQNDSSLKYEPILNQILKVPTTKTQIVPVFFRMQTFRGQNLGKRECSSFNEENTLQIFC